LNKIRALLLCTGNSARSIIGAAILKHMAGDAFEVCSAGTHPKGINSYTVRALEALGIDISGERSKNVSELADQEFDYVIMVCDAAAEECPVFPGKTRRIHWSFVDPAAVEGTDDEKLRAFQRTAREMKARLAAFMPVAKEAAGFPG
jgi:arsenate reductase